MHSVLYLMLIMLVSTTSYARTLTVAQDGSGDFDQIWNAIQAAEEGDTVFVKAGNYGSPGLPIVKSIILKGAGADQTILSFSLTAFSIAAEHVVIEGFDILANGEGRSLTLAVSIHNCSPTIRHNIIRGAHTAISVSGQAQPLIQNNEIYGAVAIELTDTTDSVDARFNWWGTDVSNQIEALILDGNDQNGLGVVHFEPWLKFQNNIATLVNPPSWGHIKRLFQ